MCDALLEQECFGGTYKAKVSYDSCKLGFGCFHMLLIYWISRYMLGFAARYVIMDFFFYIVKIKLIAYEEFCVSSVLSDDNL